MKKTISYQIIECALEVHNSLGFGFLEKVHKNALAFELLSAGFKIEVEKQINTRQAGTRAGSKSIG